MKNLTPEEFLKLPHPHRNQYMTDLLDEIGKVTGPEKELMIRLYTMLDEAETEE